MCVARSRALQRTSMTRFAGQGAACLAALTAVGAKQRLAVKQSSRFTVQFARNLFRCAAIADSAYGSWGKPDEFRRQVMAVAANQ